MQELRRRPNKTVKKSTVQLTSLLDLLFVMIFVSLMQEKATPEMMAKLKEKKEKGKITRVKIQSKPKAKPKKDKPKAVTAIPKSYFVEAIFSFKPTSSSLMQDSGTYKMLGTFDEKTRELRLNGSAWVDRPTGYDMVPLNGKIAQGNKVFSGRIDAPNCQNFSLKKIQEMQKSPISGIWEGKYTCGQGLTGLTLTIK